MRVLSILAFMLVLASQVAAAPNVAQATQKGSLLIFPDIDVRLTRSTLIRLQNDGSQSVSVKCIWMDGNKHRTDFTFTMTKNQAFWFDAKSGSGTHHINPFPYMPANGFDNPYLPGGGAPYGAGLLACFAGGGRPVKWNHLSGTATVYDSGLGLAYEYSAYAFFVPVGMDLEPVSASATLNLNGVDYDSCPLYQIGQFSPAGAPLADVTVGGNRLAIVGCTLYLNQDWSPVYTKLQFDVWNGDEVKFTGAFECADSWHETDFTNDFDAAPQVFERTNLGADAGRYRIQGVKSTQCPDSEAVGVLAVQSTSLVMGTQPSLVGTTLAAAGKIVGKIVRDGGGGGPVPEGGIR